MPFRLPFNFPFFYNNYRYRYPNNFNITPTSTISNNSNINTYIPEVSFKKVENDMDNNTKSHLDTNIKKTSESIDDSEAFFEIFGLKLYFDDILIICILFFLYSENVQDEELFICLILLLLT